MSRAVRTSAALALAAGLLGACATVGDAPAPPPAPDAPDALQWWRAAPQSGQYGAPGTDHRLLRVDCADGGLWIGGPWPGDGREGDPARVTLAGQDRHGELAYAGDGLNFAVPVERDDPALALLLAGAPLEVAAGEEAWRVPGEGAAAVLKPVVKGCR